MFCHKCGAKLVNEAAFCSICGTKVELPSDQAHKNGIATAAKIPVSGTASVQVGDPAVSASATYENQSMTEAAPAPKISDEGKQYRAYYEQTVEKPFATPKAPNYSNIRPRTAAYQSMGWHKFLIYFSLWVGAIGNILGGIVYLVGGQYMSVNPYTGELTSYSSRIYDYYEGLQGIDIAMGIAFIATGIMFAIARNALANYKENALKLLMVAYGNAIADNVVYMIFISAIIGTEAISSSFVISLIGSIVMTVVNYIYYKNREYMFYN